MSRLLSLHNKTQEVGETDLPYNPNNRLLMAEDLRALFDAHGLKGVAFNNLFLYRTAMCHRSYCTMKNDDVVSGNDRCPDDCIPLQDVSYERLEFLGDSILGMVIARYLYERFPDRPEGFLSGMRTKLVNGRMLGSLADRMGIPTFAIISKQIEAAQGRNNFKIMEDIFEALIGAIYVDFQDKDVQMPADVQLPYGPLSGAGYYVAEQWIVSIIEKYVDFAELICARTNYKDMLVKHMQHTAHDAPRFFEIEIRVTDAKTHQKEFTYCVKDRTGAVLGTAKGGSKKEAENLAAKKALEEYYGVSTA